MTAPRRLLLSSIDRTSERFPERINRQEQIGFPMHGLGRNLLKYGNQLSAQKLQRIDRGFRRLPKLAEVVTVAKGWLLYIPFPLCFKNAYLFGAIAHG